MQIESPNDARVVAEVDRTFAALRVSHRPLEYRTKDLVGGLYRGAWSSGLTTTLATNDRIFSMRYTSIDRLFVLLRLQIQATVQAAYGTAQENLYDLVKLTAMTASDGGGTDLGPLNNGYRLLPACAPSEITSLRVASATAITVGSPNPVIDSVVGRVGVNLANTLGASAEGDLYRYVSGQGCPLYLGKNEGLNARIGLTQGATGVIRLIFSMEWAEIPLAAL